MENLRLVWIDQNMNENDMDTRHILEQLREIIPHVTVFLRTDECVSFLEKVANKKVFIITSGSMGQQLVRCIHPMKQVVSIYIFCGDPARHSSWATEWIKIKGIYNRIQPICDGLKKAVK